MGKLEFCLQLSSRIQISNSRLNGDKWMHRDLNGLQESWIHVPRLGTLVPFVHSSLRGKGVIRCPALRNDTDADILAYFQEESVPVTEVRRITSRKQGSIVNTHTFIITFSTPALPQTVTIGYQRYTVTVYIPNPLRCRNCQKYGHHEKRCRRATVCQFCGREGHTDENDCDIAGRRCVNCEGKHAASSRDCPTWGREREILRVKYTRSVSFPEARRIVESGDTTGPSYAQVTRAKKPVDSVTVKDASVQASEDRPAFGSQVPDFASSKTCKVLVGNPSRFRQKPSKPPMKQPENKQPPLPTNSTSNQNKPHRTPPSPRKHSSSQRCRSLSVPRTRHRE
ncbi:uncharacterized protein LOC117328351 [Pecten maximus]|uniref:uncharacterized protein LOC117328351 n=1 Tax=Pecten maximus TaxID=6579 RepID=UPI001457E8D3|nr:uncharacterized protein LOC117328351 [Pecten maximus]